MDYFFTKKLVSLERKKEIQSLWKKSKLTKIKPLKIDKTKNDLGTIQSRNYCVDLSCLTNIQIKKVKEDLTVKLFDEKEKEIITEFFSQIELENGKKYIKVPVAYGNYVFGKAQRDLSKYKQKDESFDERWFFDGVLRTDPPQKKVIDSTVDFLKTSPTRSGMVILPCGFGKCLAKGTRIWTFNRFIQNVEDLKEGDYLVDENGNPTQINSTCKGNSEMYKVIPIVRWNFKWIDFVCPNNEEFMKNCKHYFKSHCKKYDGNSSIKMVLDAYTTNKDHILTLEKDGRIVDEKIVDVFIRPLNYKLIQSTETNRFQLKENEELKIEDIDGHLDFENEESFNILKRMFYSKNKESLLFFIMDHKLECIKKHDMKDWNGMHFWFLNTEKISTSNRKLLHELMRFCGFFVIQHHSNLWTIHTITLSNNGYPKSVKGDKYNFYGWEFKIQTLNKSSYYGFTLGQSKRFMLSSGHITHNTMCSFHIAKQMRCKTLFLAEKIDLIYQPMERLKIFFPKVKLGIVHSNKLEYEDCDIVFATFQTIRSRKENIQKSHPDFFDSFELIIVDEAHHIAARTYFETLHYFNSRYRIGLTATPRRHDDTHKMLFYALGPICVQVFRKTETTKTVIDCLQHEQSTSTSSSSLTVYKSEKPKITVLDYDNQHLERIVKTTKMMKRFQEDICFSHLTRDYRRNNHIAREWLNLTFPDQKRKTICLSHRFDHHVHLLNAFTTCIIRKQIMECPEEPNCTLRIIYYDRKKKEIKFEPIFRMKRSKHMSFHEPKKFNNFVNLHFGTCSIDIFEIGKPTVNIKDHKDFIGLEIDFENHYPIVRFGIFQGGLTVKTRPIIKSFVFKQCKVIFMTYLLGKEGLDEDSLDTVIMASPAGQGSTIQAQGRALRKIYKTKDGSWSRNNHHTIYVMDQYNEYFVNQSKNALRYFKSQKHCISVKKIIERKRNEELEDEEI